MTNFYLAMPKQQGRKTTRQKARNKGKPYPRSEPGDGEENGTGEPLPCPICEEVIKESTDDAPGDEPIFCEGQCEAWYHRRCAGISKSAYESASESENPFYCMSCLQVHYNNEISQLKEQIAALSSKIIGPSEGDSSQQSTQTSVSGRGSNTTTQSSSTALPNGVTNSSHKMASTESTSARKFNVVLFGIAECSKGTKKFERDNLDLNKATAILTEVDNSVQPFSIRDTVRLGKYNPTGRPRPVLVTLNRSSDVASLLSKRAQVKSPYVIKPDLSREARTIESHLLKARWSLLQAKTPKSDIKIRGDKLYVKGKLFGQADTTGFTPGSASSNVSTVATMDTTTTTSSS